MTMGLDDGIMSNVERRRLNNVRGGTGCTTRLKPNVVLVLVDVGEGDVVIVDDALLDDDRDDDNDKDDDALTLALYDATFVTTEVGSDEVRCRGAVSAVGC